MLLVTAVMVSGCADYSSREDSITVRAGNAPAANSFIHTIDHWPANAGNVRVTGG
ncbi:hypothetical protein ACSBLW_11120 [Thioclava sp. FR2]|uniref:hypothetical protein n=1 Tax=Thioclava sp. FR2 TaxID=3445780 RepID=UPI003EBD4FCD